MGAPNPKLERYELDGAEAFLSAHDGERGRAIVFGKKNGSPSTIRTWIGEAAKELRRPLPEIRFKLVGDGAPFDAVTDAFRALGIAPKAAIRRKAERVEILFYPDEGRVRVASGANEKASAPEPKNRRTRVLIVDDSPTIRKLLTGIFRTDPGLEVVGEAERPSQVEALIRDRKPDVITLDLHMPEMDGVRCLKNYLPLHPIPTVIISSISMDEGPLVLSALEAGAVDYIQKPTFDQLRALTPLIVEKVRSAARARVQKRPSSRAQPGEKITSALRQDRVLAFGSSTGGTEALTAILARLPADIPPIVCVQHIPAVFSLAFAKRLDTLCPFEVKEARDGDEVRRGRALIAPGGFQMSLVERAGSLFVRVVDAPPVNRHRPSVDVLFDSAAKILGSRAFGIILTGMGDDGADGLVAMRKAGARTIAQDEATSVVFGMPREAIARGGAERVAALPDIAGVLAEWLSPATRTPAKAARKKLAG